MPNQFHLAVWPQHDGDLSRRMHELLTAHGRRHHMGVARPQPWLDWVNGQREAAAVQRIRQSVNRSASFGSAAWMAVTAAMLGLDASLRPIGRPQKLVET